MHPCKYILLILCLLANTVGMAQGPGKASLQVDRESNNILTVHFEWGNLFVGITEHHYSELQAKGMTIDNGEVGKPALPTMSTIVTLPHGSHLTLEALEHVEETWNNEVEEEWPLAPVVGPWIKDSLWPGYHPDKETYTTDAYYRGGEPIEVRHIGTMMGNEVYRITVRPTSYNPVRRSLLVSTVLNATLEQSGKTLLTQTDSTLPERMLIVSRQQFREGLQPCIRWKRQEGYDVDEIYADTNKRDVVKALIDNQWEDSDGRWPRYLLLVGDVAQLQSYIGTSHPSELNHHATDLYYAEHTGDYLPDAMVGRWPVNDTAELRAVVEKTLRYEQCSDLDTIQLKRAILVAGKENSSPAPTTTNGQVNYLKGRIGVEHPTLDTSCYYNPDSQNQRAEILNDISQGAAFLNYTAHCSSSGWSKPSVSFASIDTLNCDQPMLYINNCCLSNAFDRTCFGKQLLLKSTAGAIGVVGATNSTLWNEDYYWAVGPKYPFSLEPSYDSLHPGAFDLWLGGAVATQGSLIVAGNLAVTAFGSPYDKFYWETYCLLGDPTLRPYLGTPQSISFSAPDTITVGTTSIRVSGSNGILISAVQGDRLLGTVRRDDHRSSELRFRQPADSLPIIITATMAQAIPVVDTIYTVMPQGHTVTFRDVTIIDTAVNFTLVNLCTDTLYNIAVQLICDDTTLAVFDAVPAFADTLAPRAEIPMHISLSVLQWERQWRGELYAYSTISSIECNPLHLHGWLDGIAPSLWLTVLNTDTVDNPHIQPNTAYLLKTLIDGICDSLSVNLTAMPTNDQLITTNSQIITEFTTPDTVSHLHIEATITRGNYQQDYDLWLTAGNRTDSFEEGFNSHPWDVSSLRPWQIDSTESHTGTYCLRSAPISGRQTSDLGLDLMLAAPDSIAFWAQTSSEKDYDKLTFSIDGRKQMELSGNAGWRRCAYPLTAGSHRLLWRYTKDDSDNAGSDCAWIDDVELPFALWNEPCGWFGSVEEVGITTAEPISNNLKASPSPTKDIVWITSTTTTKATLTDILGCPLFTVSLTAGIPRTLNMSTLTAGIYFIRTENGKSLKIIKL